METEIWYCFSFLHFVNKKIDWYCVKLLHCNQFSTWLELWLTTVGFIFTSVTISNTITLNFIRMTWSILTAIPTAWNKKNIHFSNFFSQEFKHNTLWGQSLSEKFNIKTNPMRKQNWVYRQHTSNKPTKSFTTAQK